MAVTRLTSAQLQARPASRKRANGAAMARVAKFTTTLPNVDRHLFVAQRYRTITEALLSDQGGAEQITEARMQLVRRFAAAAVLAEQIESRLANGEQIDIPEHALLCSTLVRIARQIGVNRVARAVNAAPSLEVYLRRRGQQHNDGAEAQ
jgi:hypothetical protein